MAARVPILRRSELQKNGTKPKAIARGFSPTAVWAAIVCFAWYAFGLMPLQVVLADRLGTTTAQASSAIAVVWIGAAAASATLAFHYRQPIAISWTAAGLMYLASVAPHFSFANWWEPICWLACS